MKAGIYFTHYECFGHTSRVIAISQVFKKKFPDGNFFFIQAGVSQPMAGLQKWGEVHHIPFPFVNRRNFIEPVHYADGNAAVARVQSCADLIAQQKPDIFFTEFFPLGRQECRHELFPALVKASGQGAHLYAVAGYPLLLGEDEEWREKILKLYQKIIIFSPEIERSMMAGSVKISEKKRYIEFFKRHEKKIVFAGYLLPQGEVINYDQDVNIVRPVIPEKACRVAVVRGGGAYYAKIIAQAIRASDLLGEKYYLTLVAGPSTTTEEWYLFSTLMAKKKIKNAVLLRAVLDYEGLIRSSDLCVTTASYHTAVMLLKHRKKAVVIPFEGYGNEMFFPEQAARAVLLKEKLSAIVLTIKDLTAMSLAAAVADAAHRQPFDNDIPDEWFGGQAALETIFADFGHAT